MIIGLTGKNGSGKGEAAAFLRENGFEYTSLSDALRKELNEKGIAITRENLISVGQQLRSKYGAQVLARRVLEKLVPSKNYVVDSFRHPNEVLEFRKNKDFYLWRIEADDKIRFERCARRGREEEPINFERFIEVEKLEFNKGELNKQDLIQTLEMADVIINNNSTIEELHEKAKKELEKKDIKKA
ncbi:MAG: AAA family ATPase [bacterium]